MQPIFTNNPLLLGTLIASLIVWRVVEAVNDIRTYIRLRAGARRQDRGSYFAVLGSVIAAALLGVAVAYQVPATAITFGREFFFWLGILLIYAGIALRLYAINVLGAYFTTSVAIAPEQRVIEIGPYRLIRHPSYTGILLTLFGLGLCFTNWLTPLVMVGCALVGFGYRIRVEERVLQQQLGQPYREYMRRTKRLIPFVL